MTDLQTGATASVNPDQPFRVGSVAKVGVAMAVLNLVTQGRIGLDDQVTYNAATDYAGGAGSLRYTLQDGDSVPVAYLLDRLIRVSDNVAWNMLERYIGPETINQYILSLGVQTPYTPTAPVMTPRDVNALLIRLDRGQAGISPELTQRLIGLLGSTVFRDRIPAKLPPTAYAVNKVGTLEGVVHDVGIVYAPQRSFVISVFTENLPYEEAVNLIADVAATIYWYEDWLVRAGGD